jgi:hypothetical protein
MANSDKNILITPNKNLGGIPEISLTGFGVSTISIRVPDSTTGSLSFQNSGNQLFSIDTNLSSGEIFKVINNTSNDSVFTTNSSGDVILSPNQGTSNISGNGITLPSYDTESLPQGKEGLLIYDRTLKIVRIFSSNEWVNLGIPQLVTGGLRLRLDAGDVRSYPGNGSTWYDLSGFNNNCAWSSTPGFDYRGFFRFDGSNHNGTITNTGSMNTNAEQTLIMVLRHNYNSGRRNPWNQAYAGFGTWTHEQGENISWFFGDGGGDNSPYLGHVSPTTPRGRWNVVATVRNTSTYQWYYDGISTGVNNHGYGVLVNSGANITIGNGYAGFWQGDMAMVLMYARALSNAEILQNYNTIRTRYPANN